MATNTFDVLATQTISSTVSSVTFNSIDQTYTDLYLVMKATRGITGSGSADANITFNGDTGANYSNGLLYESAAAKSSNRVNLNWMGSVGDNEYKISRIHIQDYSNNTTIKTAIGRWGGTAASESRVSSGQWRNTSPITSITITPANGIGAGSSFTLYGIRASNVGAKATGGIISQDDKYIYHTFISTGAFVPTQNLTNVDYLVVAGGGGSRPKIAGGGGAGGYRTTVGTSGGGASAESKISLTSGTSYTISVGAGGSGYSNGTDSYISGTGLTTITSIGGGCGGYSSGSSGWNPSSGGSGGGGAAPELSSGTMTGGAGTSAQGYAGADGKSGSSSPTGWHMGAGGGGAGGAAPAITATSVIGGVGLVSPIDGIARAGGGGGGTQYGDSSINASGGAGGGYGGGYFRNPTNGTANTGGGAGGGGYGGSADSATANGGSGVVIIRYIK